MGGVDVQQTAKCGEKLSFEDMLLTFVKSLLVSAFFFGLLSSVTAYMCVLFAGAGHAALSPYAVFFGPVYFYVDFFLPNNLQGAIGQSRAIELMFVFYCLYLIPVWFGRIFGYGRAALVMVLVIHYACVFANTRSPDWDGIRNIWMVNDAYGGWVSVFMVELFLLLHLLAYQYAVSAIPYRLHATRGTILVLALGVVVGFMFLAVTSMIAPH
jgi:hypothetical protein